MGFCGNFVIWFGVIVGVLDWISDIAYCTDTHFVNGELKKACVLFVIL